MAELKNERMVGFLCILFFIAAAFAIIMFSDSKNNVDAKAAVEAGNWEPYARLKLGDEKATATLNGSELVLDYYEQSLTASTTISSFNVATARIVPEIFSLSPTIQDVTIVERGDFQDIRGNKSIDKVMEIRFSRGNAASIHWDNILFDNMPKLADSYWIHPSLR